MGANLLEDGATFRVWAPGAQAVYVALNSGTAYAPNPADLLTKDAATGHWTGFISGIADGTPYRYWVVGAGGGGFKRDPYARELHYYTGPAVNDEDDVDDYNDSNGIVRDPSSYKWLAPPFSTPPFHKLVVYQLHVGVFYARDANGNDLRAGPTGQGRVSKLFDALDRVPYLSALGFNALLTLPLVEYWTSNSLGYNGTDLFSPEMDYCVDPTDATLATLYWPRINALLQAKGHPPKTLAEVSSHVDQMKLFVDICHLYGMAVIFDVVYNHAGGTFNDQSIDFFDRPAAPHDGKDNPPGNNLYFSRVGAEWTGKVFEFSENDVCEYLINNTRLFIQEYRIDGLRYDEVRVIDWNGGWSFIHNLTSTVRYLKSDCVQIAEYWGDYRPLAVIPAPRGMGFDIGYEDRFQKAVRSVLGEAAGGAANTVHFDAVKDALYTRGDVPAAWHLLQSLETHDIVYEPHDEKVPRIAALAGGGDARSWYATSRARVANGLLLTAPGVPMVFMGQEILEDKYWNDYPKATGSFIYWDALDGVNGKDKKVADFNRFMGDLIWLRRTYPGLTGEGLNVFHVHNDNRVIAFHRWIPGEGRDVVIVASLNEATFYNRSYQLGFPQGGHWEEVFNSDNYESWFNPNSQGNYGGVTADGPALHGLDQSGGITIPANGLLVFARERL
ncbi:MAG: glycoside hydrolase family 13 domain protein [Verrucomicrobiaceae bacterium]|nr:glycoside hydrolase family 13 domain protein [Verrucomicrobiaceae bacterium]